MTKEELDGWEDHRLGMIEAIETAEARVEQLEQQVELLRSVLERAVRYGERPEVQRGELSPMFYGWQVDFRAALQVTEQGENR